MRKIMPRGKAVAHMDQLGLELADTATFKQWTETFEKVQATNRSINWWIGDALLIGETRWGEEYAQVVSPEWAENHKEKLWVCKRIPRDRRNVDCNWSIHREVAAMEPEDQVSWLDQAAFNAWTVKQLKAEIEAEKLRKHNQQQPTMFPEAEESQERHYDQGAARRAGYTDDEFQDLRRLIDEVRDFGNSINGEEVKQGSPSYVTMCGLEDRVMALLPKARASSDASPLMFIEDALSLRQQGWLVTMAEEADGGWRTTLKKGERQMSYGMNGNLPCAVVEAVLTAAISDRQN
jgi:hypothetical protein